MGDDNEEENEMVGAVEIDPLNSLNNLTQLDNLQHLYPISEHLWWLALMVKIALLMIVLQFISLVALLAR